MSKRDAYLFFCLIQLYQLWYASVAGEEHANNAIARFVSARNKIEDIWLEVVKDNASKSGWAVDVMTTIPKSYSDDYFHVYMYAKERYGPTYRHYFFGDFLCTVISNQTSHGKYARGNFIPAQIMSMFLPGRGDSCQLEKGKKAIELEAPVNANRQDPMNRIVRIPYRFPFDVMVNIVKDEDTRDPVNNYMIQVNFTVDSIDKGSGGHQKNGKNNGRNFWTNIQGVPYYYGGYLYHIPVVAQYYGNWTGNKNTESKSDVPINVPVRVIGVKNGIDNPFFSAVKNSASPTGWAVKVNKNWTRYRIDSHFLLHLYVINPHDNSLHKMYLGFLCDSIVHDSRWDDSPKNNFLPRQIVDIIFPDRKGSCDWQQSTKRINQNGTVNLNPYDNPSVALPDSTYFNLVVNVLSQKQRNEDLDGYFFQVNFTIGRPPSMHNGYQYVYFNGYWQYYLNGYWFYYNNGHWQHNINGTKSTTSIKN